MACPTSTFHRFPDLPRELRDEIWRLCLPHRVVELDWPVPAWNYGYGYPAWFLDPPDHSCEMQSTSFLNSLPPVISRVCHEARTVAFETGRFVVQKQPPVLSDSEHSTVQPRPRRSWIDWRRDVLHLNWHSLLLTPGNAFRVAGLVHDFLPPSAHPRMQSICAELLDGILGEQRRAVMQALSSRRHLWLCGALVVIHVADDAAAINSGLWGCLGEERIVLVDASDAERMDKFCRFWREHGEQDDPAAKGFFEAMTDGVPKIHYKETPDEFLSDLETRWLYDSVPTGHDDFEAVPLDRKVWHTEPEDFDGRDDDPRALDYEDLPGRPFARQLWRPNRDNPWVGDVLSRMPEFTPTVMFRLCTGPCLSQEYAWSLP